LTGSDIERNGAVLSALLTRDAILPILGVLFAASGAGLNLLDLFDRLPQRFSRAALLENFPRSLGLKIVASFSAGAAAQKLLARFFTTELGFGTIVHVDTTDGIRVLFDNGDVAHVRPSGNADELRIYSVADTQVRADAIAAMGIAEPNGILRCMQKAVAVDA
jgi:phosphomannomutase